MMAVETLMDLEPREPEVQAHVDRLIRETREADLPESQVQSIVGALRWLHDESISQGGRKLAARLGKRDYMGESARKFFTNSYTLRSRLMHGEVPRRNRAEVDGRAGHLSYSCGTYSASRY